MILRFTIIVASMAFLISCQREVKAKFEITNNTDNVIDSINIRSFDNESNPNYLRLTSGQCQTYWLDMTNLPKVDGDYLLTYKGYMYKTIRFGYFSNGSPMEKVIKIKIENDTVIIEQISNNY